MQIMTINEFANRCGYFYNAEFDADAPNNGYNCKHPEQTEKQNGVGCCFQWSCPLAIPADEEDCEKYGCEYEENEFVLVEDEREVQNMDNFVYICSPYRGEVKRNKEYARYLTRKAIEKGFIPITVHLYLTEVLNDSNPEEREKGMAAGKELLKKCTFILVGDKYGRSSGMIEEIEQAKQLGKIMLIEEDGRIYTSFDYE